MLRFLNLAPLTKTPASKTRFRLVEEKRRSSYGGFEGGRHKLLDIAEQIGDADIWGALGRHLSAIRDEVSSPLLSRFIGLCPIRYISAWAVEELHVRSIRERMEQPGHGPECVVSGRRERLFGTAHPRLPQQDAASSRNH